MCFRTLRSHLHRRGLWHVHLDHHRVALRAGKNSSKLNLNEAAAGLEKFQATFEYMML